MALPLPSALIVNASYDKNTAIVVLPAVSGGRLTSRALKAWLARADLSVDSRPEETLTRVAREIGAPFPDDGLAALRFWGQTGDRPTRWIAAADPVYLEPHLEHLCLHQLGPHSQQESHRIESFELRALIDHLQVSFGGDQSIGFTRLGPYGYLSAKQPLATAQLSAHAVDQMRPDKFLPQGKEAASHRQLISEIEMALHEHDVNVARVDSGKPPLNSLWLWGGGVAGEPVTRAQPPLFSNDPLLLGYWYSAVAVAEPWLGNLDSCLELAVNGFVADTIGEDISIEHVQELLDTLRRNVNKGRLSRLILLFADGLRAEVRRSQVLRVWRRSSPLLEARELS